MPAAKVNTKTKAQKPTGNPQGFQGPRTATGKFQPLVDSWKPNTPASFWKWVEDIKPRVLNRQGKYEVWKPTDRQRQAIDAMLAPGTKGQFKHQIGLLIWPRRHGKSTAMAMVMLWMFTSRENHTTQLVGNTADHSRRVQFNTLIRTITHTPKLKKLIDEKDIQRNEIRYPKRGNLIQAMAGNSIASAFGDRVNMIWVSDFHACPDLAPFNAMQASLIDSANSMCLIDSNVDSTGGHVHAQQKAAEDDPGMYCDYLCYKDWADYQVSAPLWIDRTGALRNKSTLLPADFDRDYLGIRSAARNALFYPEQIERAQRDYVTPADLEALVNGRAFRIGAGLDRAKAVFGDKEGADNTVFSVIAKVAQPSGEPEIIMLQQTHVVPNTAQMIKGLILDAHERYSLTNLVLEEYACTDLAPWVAEQNIPCELLSATNTYQTAMFTEMYRLVDENRLVIPMELKELQEEMKVFEYSRTKTGKYSFAASGSFHDDRVFSLGAAIWSLRQQVMAMYVLGHIQCTANAHQRPLCFLLRGDQELSCGYHCVALAEVKQMYYDFKRFHTESHLNLFQFYKQYVKLTGSLIFQAV